MDRDISRNTFKQPSGVQQGADRWNLIKQEISDDNSFNTETRGKFGSSEDFRSRPSQMGDSFGSSFGKRKPKLKAKIIPFDLEKMKGGFPPLAKSSN